MKKAILYINQFFGGIGGEEKADCGPSIQEGTVGPGAAIQTKLNEIEITHTIICGDNYLNSDPEKAMEEIESLLEKKEFDFLLAGPAFQSGRYGMNCGKVCVVISRKYKVPAITCMHEESPGVDAYRSNPDIYIMKGHKSAVKLRDDASKMAAFADKIARGEEILWADAEGYFGHGIRKEVFVDRTSADRVVDMLLCKLSGEAFQTEYEIEVHDKVRPADPVTDLKNSKIALITSGGLVPAGNPDRIPSGTASVWKRYPIDETDCFRKGEFYSVHGGYDTTIVNADPEVLLPLSTVKAVLKDGEFGELEPFYYTTTGNLTTIKEARRMGEEIGEILKEDHVDGVIFVST